MTAFWVSLLQLHYPGISIPYLCTDDLFPVQISKSDQWSINKDMMDIGIDRVSRFFKQIEQNLIAAFQG
jgi:hypothetical protein